MLLLRIEPSAFEWSLRPLSPAGQSYRHFRQLHIIGFNGQNVTYLYFKVLALLHTITLILVALLKCTNQGTFYFI